MHKAQLRRRADWILSGKTHDEYAEDDDIAEIEAMSQIEYQDRQNSINSEAQKNQLQLQRAAQKGVNSRHGNEKREEEARQRILEAAQALKTRGESVSISALAREGSLSRNTVRKYKTLVDSLVKH
jgi:response regulator of citrate/malate metabolism